MLGNIVWLRSWHSHRDKYGSLRLMPVSNTAAAAVILLSVGDGAGLWNLR